MGRDARNNPHSFQRPSLPIEVKDVMGRSLRVGDRVMLQQTGAASWRISEIAPELAPGAPANIVRVRLDSHQVSHYEATGVSPMILILPAEDNPFERELAKQAEEQALAERSAMHNAQAGENGGPTLVVTEPDPRD